MGSCSKTQFHCTMKKIFFFSVFKLSMWDCGSVSIFMKSLDDVVAQQKIQRWLSLIMSKHQLPSPRLSFYTIYGPGKELVEQITVTFCCVNCTLLDAVIVTMISRSVLSKLTDFRLTLNSQVLAIFRLDTQLIKLNQSPWNSGHTF